MRHRVGQRLPHAEVRILGDVDPPGALHPRHEPAVTGDESRAIVDDPVQWPHHIRPVAQLGALVLAEKEGALERRRVEAILRPIPEQQQPGDSRDDAAAVSCGEAQVHQQPGALVCVGGVRRTPAKYSRTTASSNSDSSASGTRSRS